MAAKANTPKPKEPAKKELAESTDRPDVPILVSKSTGAGAHTP